MHGNTLFEWHWFLVFVKYLLHDDSLMCSSDLSKDDIPVTMKSYTNLKCIFLQCKQKIDKCDHLNRTWNNIQILIKKMDLITLINCKKKCQRYKCNNISYVHHYHGALDRFRCAICLGLPVSKGKISAEEYGVCSICNCYFKCIGEYADSEPKCPECRSTFYPQCEFCNSVDELTYAPNPYSLEIYNDVTLRWMCDTCRTRVSIDI